MIGRKVGVGIGLRRGNFCKSSPAPPQNFLSWGGVRVRERAGDGASRFLGYARNDMGV